MLQLKRHMLKLVSGDPSPVCKADPKTGVVSLDVAKMYKLYLQEYDPQAIVLTTGVAYDRSIYCSHFSMHL